MNLGPLPLKKKFVLFLFVRRVLLRTVWGTVIGNLLGIETRRVSLRFLGFKTAVLQQSKEWVGWVLAYIYIYIYNHGSQLIKYLNSLENLCWFFICIKKKQEVLFFKLRLLK